MTYLKIIFICMGKWVWWSRLSMGILNCISLRTGNSCSSPMAEAIMQNLMVKTSLYWEVDSAALRNWNIGRRPHKYCLRVLHEHGLRSKHFCRLVSEQGVQCPYDVPLSICLSSPMPAFELWFSIFRLYHTNEQSRLQRADELGDLQSYHWNFENN